MVMLRYERIIDLPDKIAYNGEVAEGVASDDGVVHYFYHPYDNDMSKDIELMVLGRTRVANSDSEIVIQMIVGDEVIRTAFCSSDPADIQSQLEMLSSYFTKSMKKSEDGMNMKSFNDMVKQRRDIAKGITQYAEDITWDNFGETFPIPRNDESSRRTREMAVELADTLKMRYQGSNVQYREQTFDEITVLFVAYPDESFSRTMEVEFTIDTDYRIRAENRNMGTVTDLNTVEEAVQYIDALMKYMIKMQKSLQKMFKH